MNEQDIWARDYFKEHLVFTDEETRKGLIDQTADSFIEYLLSEREDKTVTDGLVKIREIIKLQLECNYEVIYKYARSPIEKIFLVALNMYNSAFNPLYLCFIPPTHTKYAEDYPTELYETHQAIMGVWKEFQEATGDMDTEAFLAFSDELIQEPNFPLPSSFAMRVRMQVVLYHELGLFNGYHLMPQPKFGKTKLNKRQIKPDLLIWKPSNPNFRLIVECDGYQYHSDRQSFTRDRTKDRILQKQGYQVFRFSGKEINEDPIGKAEEMLEYLVMLESKSGNK